MRFFILVLTVMITLCVNFELTAQREIAILKAAQQQEEVADNQLTEHGLTLPFLLDRNQLWLQATIENRSGYFILDTGAPTLLLNNDGVTGTGSETKIGEGATGSVQLTEHSVHSFSFAGIEQGKQSAYLIDLRAFEARSGNNLLGMIGHAQLKSYELLIDCKAKELKLLPARHNELHQAGKPRYTLNLHFDGHLPIVTLKNDRQKLRFVLDTGAGANLLNSGAKKLPIATTVVSETLNVQGLNGVEEEFHYASLPALRLGDVDLGDVEFVLADLSHFQLEDGRKIDGIVGPDFLKKFRVSINFRKQKLYVW